MRNTYLWLLQLVTGGIIVVLLGAHLITQYPDGILVVTQRLDTTLKLFGIAGADTTTWASTIHRARQGIAAGLYLALVAVVLYHGLNGLRGIALEVTASAATARVITYALMAIGTILFSAILVSRLLY